MPIEKSQELYHWWVQGSLVEASNQIKIIIIIIIVIQTRITIMAASDFVVVAAIVI